MSRLFLSIPILALIACGCEDDNTAAAFQQTAVYNKPSVAIVPVIDNTKNNFEWNLSDELSSAVYSRIGQRNHLFVTDVDKVRKKLAHLGEKNNPFASDATWVKNAFHGESFVVFLELVEHDEIFQQNSRKSSDLQFCNADLNMSMRVRIFDLRGNEPKVILQEIHRDTHFVPRQFTSENFYQVAWGDPSYSVSPVGLAHASFTKDIATRIEDYILMASQE